MLGLSIVWLAVAPMAAGEASDALFSRDQGRVEGLTRWGGRLVALSSPPRALNLDAGSSEPISVPGLDELLDLAGENDRYALGRRKGALALLRETKKGWEQIALPDALASTKGSVMIRLGASGDEVLVTGARYVEGKGLLERLIHMRHGGAWRTLPAPEATAPQGVARFVLFDRDRWLMGYSRGEWGGSLWSVPVSASPVQIEPKDGAPVQSLALSKAGAILVATGLGHMGGLQGQVGRYETDRRWRALARCDNSEKANNLGWNLRADSVEGAAWDDQGRIHVFLSSQGVVRIENGKLEPETPGWPREHIYGTGLQIDGDRAVIATSDAGVLVWRLGTREAKRIPIPR